MTGVAPVYIPWNSLSLTSQTHIYIFATWFRITSGCWIRFTSFCGMTCSIFLPMWLLELTTTMRIVGPGTRVTRVAKFVQDMYAWLNTQTHDVLVNNCWVWIKKLKLAEKVRFFVWIIMHNSVQCSQNWEDGLHYLRDCPHSNEMWLRIGSSFLG